jgi:hypothetical protein
MHEHHPHHNSKPPGWAAHTKPGVHELGTLRCSSMGRFLSIDPALGSASPQQLNGYSYAADNPAASSDPTGLYLPDEGGPCYSAFELGCTDAADQNPPLTISSVAVGAASEAYDGCKRLDIC